MSPERRALADAVANGSMVADHWDRESAVCWVMRLGSERVARCELADGGNWRATVSVDSVRLPARFFSDLGDAMDYCGQRVAMIVVMEAKERCLVTLMPLTKEGG